MRRLSAQPLNDARPFHVGRGVLIVLASAVFALLLAPASVLAEEAPAEEAPAEEAPAEVAEDANVVGAPMACGKIAATRYPFLACVRGPSGGPVFASMGEGITGHVNIRSKFVRENGHWGPSGIE